MWLLEDPRAQALPRRAKEPFLIVNGHPDPRPERFCAALAQAYRKGVQAAGGRAQAVAVGALSHSRDRSEALEQLRDACGWSVIFPLWLDKPPSLLERFLVEAALPQCTDVIVTMTLPAFIQRSPRDGGLFPGMGIDRTTFIGSVETISQEQRANWLMKVQRLGRKTRDSTSAFQLAL